MERRLAALETGDGLYWRHEDWVDYFARKERGESVDHLTPKPSPALLAFLETVEADGAAD